MEGIINSYGPMLNAYPDSLGPKLDNIIQVLRMPELTDAFSSFYILPSIYNSDLDRGFSVIDYNINEEYACIDDLKALRDMRIDLKLDFILNHASVLSPQFLDLLKNGEKSEYADFFIDWNKFWKGFGQMTSEGYIKPDDEYIKDMFFRKPGLPILMVRMPDGKNVPYWNTFYQEVIYRCPEPSDLVERLELQYSTAVNICKRIRSVLDKGGRPVDIDMTGYEKYKDSVTDLLESDRHYLGQMDLNIKSPLVWEHYRNTLKTLSEYGAKIVRLDAFAYAPKTPGLKNFLNEPDTWDVLDRVKKIADEYGLTLLPEIHASYSEGIYAKVAGKGYMTYDFFLPGLIIHSIENNTCKELAAWAKELIDRDIQCVNMLGCHDGIPLLDLKGILSESDITALIDTIVSRGGYVKDLHGQKNMYYQVNATYYSALGADDHKMLLARAIQMFMPGKPQVWYLDLFAGCNDHDAVKRAGAGGHKEINRTNLTDEYIRKALTKEIVLKQLALLKMRNTHPAFAQDSAISVSADYKTMTIEWINGDNKATLIANFDTYNYNITLS